jgi:thiol-disulfide isomerase/thioredoxin
MKNFLLLIILLFAVSCKIVNPSSTVNISIRTSEEISPSKYYIGLYYFLTKSYLGQRAGFWEKQSSKLILPIEPGKYTLVIFSQETESARIHFVIPDNETEFKVNVTLTPLSLGDIKNVAVQNLNTAQIEDLVKVGDVWKLKDTSIIKLGDKFNYLINGKIVWDLNSSNIQVDKVNATINHVCIDKSIEFNPLKYGKKIHPPQITVSGCNLYHPFNKLIDCLEEFRSNRFNFQINTPHDSADYEGKYRNFISILDSLESQYNEPLVQMVYEEKMSKSTWLHPAFIKIQSLWKNRIMDTVAFANYSHSEIFEDYFSSQLDIANKFDPNSFVLHGRFINNFLRLSQYVSYSPSLRLKFSLPDNYFFDYILNFVNRSSNRVLCSNILYNSAQIYSFSHEDSKSEYLLNILISNYPESYSVVAGHATKLQASLKAGIGSTAKDFEVTTLNGQNFKLSDHQGKYIFLDFWGSWCVPCIEEIPFLVKLHSEIPPDKFTMIGLAGNDNSLALKNCIEKYDITYPNALAHEELLSAYGITVYPTTLLIDPDGIICGKGLRGQNLVQLVLEKMK